MTFQSRLQSIFSSQFEEKFIKYVCKLIFIEHNIYELKKDVRNFQ